MFERILVPLDGSTRAARAVSVAAHMAGAVHGTVILASVVNHFVLSQCPQQSLDSRGRSSDDISLSEAEAYLGEMTFSPELVQVRVERAIVAGPTASALLSAATSYRADLIVLTSHGRSGMMNKALGSVAEKVVGRATIPVLLLREDSRLSLVPHAEMFAKGVIAAGL